MLMAHIYLFVICVIIILQLLLRLLSASPLYLGYRNLALPDAFHLEGLGRVSNFIKVAEVRHSSHNTFVFKAATEQNPAVIIKIALKNDILKEVSNFFQ
jgi:hypothetical protein